MSRVLFLWGCITLFSMCSHAFEIENVSFDVTEKRLVISSSAGKILEHSFDDSSLSYEYILETPYFTIGGWDGVVEVEYSEGIREFPRGHLTSDDFPKFQFISGEIDTVGLLIGRAGATGRSSQEAYFINTVMGHLNRIDLTDMSEMEWIMDSDRIVGYKQYDTSFSFGPVSTRWGNKPRVSEVFIFDSNGMAQRDKNRLMDIYAREYEGIIFSGEEKVVLQKNVMHDMVHRILGEKVVDFVYYGLKLGRENEVFGFLDTIDPVYRKEVDMRKEVY